jgi:hypothetical protein
MLGLSEAEGLTLGDTEGLTEGDGVGDMLGLSEGLTDGDTEGLTEGLIEADSETAAIFITTPVSPFSPEQLDTVHEQAVDVLLVRVCTW